MSAIAAALGEVVEGRDLSAERMRAVMGEIMDGAATSAQIAGLLVGLRMKGETVTEIAAAASVMRERAVAVPVAADGLIDIVGTGGDGASLFNVSTASVFVAAAAGLRVAKHGNRSVSSRSGAADLLEAAGARLDLSPEQVANVLERTGVGFLFAPSHHGATRHAAAPRRELGLRTLFNLLGPLTNPAGTRRQVIGVYDRRWVEPVARVLAELGSECALVVHSADGLDEISVAATSHVAELRNGQIALRDITPEQLGVPRHSLDGLRVENAEQSLLLVREALGGGAGAALDLVALNAGAALYVSGLFDDLPDAVAKARALCESGVPLQRLEAFVAATREV